LSRLAVALLISALVSIVTGLLPEGAQADGLVIASARVEGSRIHLTIRNDGDHLAEALSLALTTRAGGYMVGTAAHPLPELAPGARHEIELPLPVWAPERPDLLSVITQRGCCTTRAVLLPQQVSVEVSHLLPLPLEDVAPAAKE
jgi:hypothetical protein